MSLEVKCVGVLLSDTEFKPKFKNIFFIKQLYMQAVF